MRKSLLATLLAITTAGAVTLAGAPANAAPTANDAGTLVSTVEGTFTDVDGGAGTVTGEFTPSRFDVQNDQLVATGTLHSVLTNAAGETVGTADTPVTLPVDTAASHGTDAVSTLAACNILHLVLGPLDLNLLGLAVHLDRVVLDITANSGPGNLLGNLLCAVAGLLDGAGALSQIAALLNQILALLGLLAA